MKNLKAIIIILGIALIGFMSVFLYNQQEENRISKFESYEIRMLEDKVAELYNADKTDLNEAITKEQLAEVKDLLAGKEKPKLQQVWDDFEMAQEMFEFQSKIHTVFEDVGNEVVKANLTLSKISNLEKELEAFKDQTLFYERNTNELQIAQQQVFEIEEAKELVERLLADDDNFVVLTEGDLEIVNTLINKIKNQEVKDELLASIAGIEILAEEDEEVAEDRVDNMEEADSGNNSLPPSRQETSPPASTPRPPNRRPANPGTSDPDAEPEPAQPDPQPEPVPPEPEPEPDPEPDPEPVEPDPELEPDPEPEPEPEPEPDPDSEEIEIP